MYAYIIGKIQKIASDHIIIENNNIGYRIITPNPYAFMLEEIIKIHVHLVIKEDAHELYGFRNINEKDLFEKLISVTGIGPKTACAIIAGTKVESVIDAIESGNAAYLMKFPKVGSKTAQQIILDLKGKLQGFNSESGNEHLNEAILALQALGYKDKEIERVVKQLGDKPYTTEQYITDALKLMLK